MALTPGIFKSQQIKVIHHPAMIDIRIQIALTPNRFDEQRILTVHHPIVVDIRFTPMWRQC